MTKKYECKVITGSDGHTRAECESGDIEDSYTIEPDFSNFPQGGLAIARQFGPNETEDEANRNVHAIVIEKRDIVDKLKDFLKSTRKTLTAEHVVDKDFTISYKFEKESHGWLRAEMTTRLGGEESTTDILIHKDVVPFMVRIVDQNF